MRITRREKVFGPGRAVPLDRNAKARVQAYARAWSHQNRLPGQHKGPITRAFLDVLAALLWDFHNSRSGVCFPSYERIAEKAECCRRTVAEALKVLEWAGVLTWQHRIVRIRERCRDLFGHWSSRWRVIRTSNAYAFRDPQAQLAGVPASECKNPSRTQNQETNPTLRAPDPAPKASIEEEHMATEVRQAAQLVLNTVRLRRMRALGLA
jgi:hypothetical protein